MIRVLVFQTADGEIAGYQMEGHADYGEYGHDIVCAACSVLAINTINSIENFTEDRFTEEAAEDGGFLSVRFPEGTSKEAQLLLQSMVFGLKDIQKQSGKRTIQIRYEEV